MKRRYDAPTSFTSGQSSNEESPLEKALEKQRRETADAAKAGPPKGAALVKDSK